jgi:hypothetical protein
MGSSARETGPFLGLIDPKMGIEERGPGSF